MSTMNSIDYKPYDTIKAFIKDYIPGELFYLWIVGPFGSGKTTGLFMKLVYMAMLQEPSPDGIRRTKAVIIRNTAPQLNDTTLASWFYWFKPGQAGDWHQTDKRFTLKFADVECEVLFRPLDTPQDISRVLSLEVTFAIIDEFVEIPREIVEAVSARCGRYFPDKGGKGATNWGMWGSSNPSTEDNWWYEHLHDKDKTLRWTPGCDMKLLRLKSEHEVFDEVTAQMRMQCVNQTYFKQPSALGPDVENLKNLPPYVEGNRSYYTNLVQGKADDWVKQFVECEWGYSVTGKPVIANFRAQRHISRTPLRYNPALPLVAGFDPGLAGSAIVFGQQDLHGRLLILGELVQENMGSERIISERLKPYLRRRFPNAPELIIAPDPAALNRSQTDEVAVIAPFRAIYQISCESNNRLPLRVDALDYFCKELTDVGEALLIDEKECPKLCRALKGGWRWEVDNKKGGVVKGVAPEKNQWSHVGDASGYLARYFRRETNRELRYGFKTGNTPRFRPPVFRNNYNQT